MTSPTTPTTAATEISSLRAGQKSSLPSPGSFLSDRSGRRRVVFGSFGEGCSIPSPTLGSRHPAAALSSDVVAAEFLGGVK